MSETLRSRYMLLLTAYDALTLCVQTGKSIDWKAYSA